MFMLTIKYCYYCRIDIFICNIFSGFILSATAQWRRKNYFPYQKLGNIGRERTLISEILLNLLNIRYFPIFLGDKYHVAGGRVVPQKEIPWMVCSCFVVIDLYRFSCWP